MAIDLCSKNSDTCKNITMSPRISFSHDLSQSDTTLPAEQLLPSTDFNFCIQLNPDHHHHASMADELFSDGKIIPAQIKPQQPPPPVQLLPPRPPAENEQHNSSKSFWGFKRSSSCGNGYARSLCPIPLMSRSNSTGSSGKRKDGCSQKQHSNFQKPPLRKVSYSYGNNGSNGVRVSPVLNLGFGSLFSGGRKK